MRQVYEYFFKNYVGFKNIKTNNGSMVYALGMIIHKLGIIKTVKVMHWELKMHR